MNKTFTFNHLLLLAYNETNPKETEDICNFLADNEQMIGEYMAVQDTRIDLDKLFCDPSENIISELVSYSKAMEVIKVKPAIENAIFIKN